MEIRGEKLIGNASELLLESQEAAGNSGAPANENQTARPLEADRMVTFAPAGPAGLMPEPNFQFEPVTAGLRMPDARSLATLLPGAVVEATAAGADGLSLNDVRDQLREDISMLNDLLSNWPPGAGEMSITLHQLELQPDGSYRFVDLTLQVTRDQAESLVTGMEELKESIGDMSQLQPLDLESAQEQSDSTLQTISNILKYFSEIQKSLLQNLKA